MSQSYSASSSSSTTYSSSTSSGQPHTTSQTTRSSYDDRTGGMHERVTAETGKPTVVETTQIPTRESTQQQQGRVEDISKDEADRRYLEAMEDEYAKREGGA